MCELQSKLIYLDTNAIIAFKGQLWCISIHDFSCCVDFICECIGGAHFCDHRAALMLN